MASIINSKIVTNLLIKLNKISKDPTNNKDLKEIVEGSKLNNRKNMTLQIVMMMITQTQLLRTHLRMQVMKRNNLSLKQDHSSKLGVTKETEVVNKTIKGSNIRIDHTKIIKGTQDNSNNLIPMFSLILVKETPLSILMVKNSLKTLVLLSMIFSKL